MVKPLHHARVVKKRTKKFARHQSDRVIRIRNSGWRKPKGIDSRVRRRFRGNIPMPNIGYGSDKRTRNLLPNGFYPFMITNLNDLEMLLMHNRKYCGIISKKVSAKTREKIVARAKEIDVKLLNGKARFRKEEAA